MNTEVIIPREKTYKLHEGRYRAKISGVVNKPAKSGDGVVCYIHFEVQVRGMERWECCARAIFPLDLHPGSQLRCFLESLLGNQFFTDRSGQPIDLKEVLRDLDCEIDVVHGKHDESKFDWPMVLVQNAYPAATTTKEAKD
jgi:hypothetical protein